MTWKGFNEWIESVLQEALIGEKYMPQENIQTINSLKLYTTAASLLDTQVAPMDTADGFGAYGCALTMNGVAEKAWGHQIGGGASTLAMYGCLIDKTKYAPVAPENALAGDIIISPTSMGANPSTHGHVGCVAKYGILSNNSEDGRLEEQWTLPAWQDYYGTAMGFPVFVFRPL